MSTQTDTPVIQVASFEHRGGKTYLRADTTERVSLLFEIHPIALAIMSLTLDPALRAERDKLRAQEDLPGPPSAPDSPEGLEG